jgi:hypothetical protein
MKQQTAVEWLIDQVEDFIGLIPVDIIEKAKAMEKEQIKDAWIATDNELQRLAAEQYYNETYNK